MKKNWILIAWDNPLKVMAIHKIEGATRDEVEDYANRLWDVYGESLDAISYTAIDNSEHYFIGG